MTCGAAGSVSFERKVSEGAAAWPAVEHWPRFNGAMKGFSSHSTRLHRPLEHREDSLVAELCDVEAEKRGG